METESIIELKKEKEIDGIEIFDDYILVDGYKIFVNEKLREPILKDAEDLNGSIQQFRNISKIPGLCNKIGLPDFHVGYALPIGSVACVDLSNPEASVSPDGVGFDINCGVRCLKTNLTIDDILNKREDLANLLLEAMPLEGAAKNTFTISEMNKLLERGMSYLLERDLCTEDDIDKTESRGYLPVFDSIKVLEEQKKKVPKVTGDVKAMSKISRIISQAAIGKGIQQLGSLGSGNHYLEFQEVETLCNQELCEKLGIFKGQILISIHTGSRGLGHKCCTDILEEIQRQEYEEYLNIGKTAYKEIKEDKNMTREEKAIKYQEVTALKQKLKKEINVKKETLSYIRYDSDLGRKYIQVMNAASNFAWGNRSMITKHIRDSVTKLFPQGRVEMIYDVCHNIAKNERGPNGENWLVHRKGASRILPPNHEDLPNAYREIGQPVLIGGSMGTNSYLIVGDENCKDTIYSACHGAGRLVSRADSKKKFDYSSIINDMNIKNIIFRSGTESGMVEECGDCYKDVDEVVNHSEKMKISKSVCRVKPVLVIKS